MNLICSKMKRMIFLCLWIVPILNACKKSGVENINGQTVDERLKASLNAYQNKLTSAAYGWKMVVFPEGLVATDNLHSAFSYYLEFTADNRVSMLSDFSAETASELQTGSYRLSALQRPTLIFDTYSYVAIPADPNLEASKSPTGKPGKGWGSDFQFAFTENDQTIGDTIHLDGILHHSRAFMVRATQAEQADFKSEKFAASMVMEKFISYFRRLSVDGKDLFEISPAISGKGIEISYVNGTTIKRAVSINYYYSPGRIHFLDPILVNGMSISSMDNLSFDLASTDKATCTINGKTAIIQGANEPLVPDDQSGVLWKESQPYYFSYNGFTVNGVTDGFGIKKWKFNNKLAFNRYLISTGGVAVPLVWNETKDDLYQYSSDEVYKSGLVGFLPIIAIKNQIFFFGVNYAPTDSPVWLTNEQLSGKLYYTILKSDGKTWDLVFAENSKIWMRLDREI